MDFDLGAFRWHVGLVYKWSEGMIIDMNSWGFFCINLENIATSTFLLPLAHFLFYVSTPLKTRCIEIMNLRLLVLN